MPGENELFSYKFVSRMDISSETLKRNFAKGVRENLNKCNLCNSTSGHEGNFRMHLKNSLWTPESGEKSHKCNQCG